MSSFKKIAIIGAGQMGQGIAQVAASHAKVSEVVLFDVAKEQLEKAQATIKKGLEKLASKGRLPDNQSVGGIYQRLVFSDELSAIAKSEFVIEAIVENEQVKCNLFQKVEALVDGATIIASNTSSIPITKLAGAIETKERVIGMHFMNPVPIMPLVEMITSPLTSEKTAQVTQKLAEAMGKIVVCSQDYPGFIVNRILMPMINEAFFTWYEGVATPDDIDQAMKLGTNQPMGPLQLADFIGLDTCLFILEVMHDGLGDPKFRPCPKIKQLVQAGWLGRKSKRGVYIYDN